jgi:hypothetical protein
MRAANSAIRIIGVTKRDLTAATVLRLEYIKPDGSTGFFPGSLLDGQKVYYDASDSDITPGPWQFRVMATVGGKTYRATQYFKETFK